MAPLPLSLPLRSLCLLAALLGAACGPDVRVSQIPQFTINTARSTPEPTPTPTPVVTPTPTPTPAPVVPGRVLGRVDGEERPLPGARVATTDGRSVETDEEGRFRLPGDPPADATYAVSAPGHIGVSINGYRERELTFRLQPVPTVTPPPPSGPMVVSGRVVDATGTPRSGIVVSVADAFGAAGNPATSDLEGRFSVVLTAPERRLQRGTLLAVDSRRKWLGLVTELNLAGAQVTVDGDPKTPGADPIRLSEAVHETQLSIDGTAAPSSFNASLELLGPDGTSQPLVAEGGRFLVANLPGGRYDLRAVATDSANRLSSSFRVVNLEFPWRVATSRQGDIMLAPPQFVRGLSYTPGQTLRWLPVWGARAYALELSGNPLAPDFSWQALTTGTETAFVFPGGRPPAGRYTLTLTAWDAPDLPQAAQAAPGAPPPTRYEPRLRYRKASRSITVTL
ncbi:MAG: carboxypeptidase-like regulatory domain-containing protein [Candidatus Sericytochromatia bacterium]|nr:carboxypeptidase-like regulatory domain-containing protein [Candidatus Sericytochromatia bacterium]